jgi:hypothetical protein
MYSVYCHCFVIVIVVGDVVFENVIVIVSIIIIIVIVVIVVIIKLLKVL